MAHFIQIQWLNGSVWQDVTTQSGTIGTGQTTGDGKVAYWTSTHTDKDNFDGTVPLRLVATPE